MNTLTASEARANLYRLIDQTVESHEPIIISGKRSNAVLLSAEDWSAIQRNPVPTGRTWHARVHQGWNG